MVDPSRRDRPGSPAASQTEPVRRPLRILCGVLGALLVALALAAAAAEPNPWLSLPPMAAGALLLMPALGARAPASQDEQEQALARALELAAAGRALLGPGLFGLLATRLLESSQPGFALDAEVVGAIAAALIAALLASGLGCALAAVYYRARALGR
jgi:hypothetical protein